MELTSLQKTTVEAILDLYNPCQKVFCEFKAPTGSGKTLMASYFISKMIENNNGEKFVFVIATPSSSSLPFFFEQKINKYKVDLPFSKFEVEYVQSPSLSKSDKIESINKIIPQPNKVYIFGKSSFGKGRILSECGIIDDFVLSAVDKGYKLIYIRDEAHIGGEKADNSNYSQNFEKLMSENASFLLKMTATPDRSNPNRVELKESELNNPVLNDGKYLLKTTPVPLLNKDLKDDEVLEDAVARFKNIKREYAELNVGIRPAMLIQVDNDSATDKVKALEFAENLNRIKKVLQIHNISWAQYFGNGDKDSNRVYLSDFSLDDITQNNSDIDAVIFKIGPSTGWDIPRACMLVQLRNVSSQALNIQTIGRIKRNPYPNLEKNPVTDKYYVYSNAENADDNCAKMYVSTVKDKHCCETFLSIDIANRKSIEHSVSSKEFCENLKKWLNKNKNYIKQAIDDVFINNHTAYKRILSKAGGNEIYALVTNPFIFLRDYKRLLASNSRLYDVIKTEVVNFCEQEKIQEEFVFNRLFLQFKSDLSQILSQSRNMKPVYKISEQRYDPKSYVQLYDKSVFDERVSREYLFDINKDDMIDGNRQPLDSNPERAVFNLIYKFAEDSDKIKIWAKNQPTSTIFGEYIDDVFNVKKSYFDFIIKFKNNFLLYIEVKGIKDINPNKTEQLKKAYADYFDNLEGNLFLPNLAIAVWQVDDKNTIRNTVFYDKKRFTNELNALNASDLLKTLSEVQI